MQTSIQENDKEANANLATNTESKILEAIANLLYRMDAQDSTLC